MKLVLVHDWLTGMRGGEKCLEIICRRYPHAELFTLLRRRGATSPAIERMKITTSFLQRVPGIARHYRYFLPLMPRAIEQLRVPADVDLVLSFNHAVAKGIPVPAGVPHICYCFTPMRYAWHLRGQYFGSATNGRRRFFGTPVWARDKLLDRMREWDAAVANRVTQFVAISRTVADRIRECYGRQSEVINPPVDTGFYSPADVGREDFYLCVSALVPYKRIDIAIDACRGLGRKLIVVGEGPSKKRLARQAGLRVTFLGWQSNERIRDLFRRCRALLFPGIEDFGIVPLEAQACGAPVIAFDGGGATETVLPAGTDRAGTGRFFSEPTPASLAAAIRAFERHPELISASLARVQALRFGSEIYEKKLVSLLDATFRGRSIRSGAYTMPMPLLSAIRKAA